MVWAIQRSMAESLSHLRKAKDLPAQCFAAAIDRKPVPRNDMELSPGTFRVSGDTLEIFPAYEDHKAYPGRLFRR